MVSFADVQGGNGGSNGSTFRRFDEDEIGEDGMDEYVQHPEKKRRLTVEQVQFLEKSFDVENKLEPERKIQLAKDLGLQPRQVAIWFQNRRARWKTKQLEKDYESLEASYTNLKANYDHLLKEKDKLKAEVANLTEKVLLREETEKLQEPPLQKCVFDSASLGTCKQEDIASSGKSEDILVSESPHCTDGVHSSVLEHCDSSYAFDPDQSDLSQDEDDNLSKTLLPSHIFPKLEDVDYSDPPESSCHFGFAEEDDAFWSWSY